MQMSKNYLIKYGRYLDLGSDGDFYIEDTNCDWRGNYLVVRGDYSWKGWLFTNCELHIIPENIFDPVMADDVLLDKWDTFAIYPTDKTEVVKPGFGNLEGTNFEKFAG